jgi:hypothetical protein
MMSELSNASGKMVTVNCNVCLYIDGVMADRGKDIIVITHTTWQSKYEPNINCGRELGVSELQLLNLG